MPVLKLAAVFANRRDALSADTHWREVHGRLALKVDSAMPHYYQPQIVHRSFGPAWHGLVLL